MKRIYLFGIEEEGKHTRIDFRTPHEEIEVMDLILIAMKALHSIAELCPPAEPKIQEALKVLELDQIYDPDSLN